MEGLFSSVSGNISHQKYPSLILFPNACSGFYISTSAIPSFESNIPHARRVFLKYRNLKEEINEISETVPRNQFSLSQTQKGIFFSSLGLYEALETSLNGRIEHRKE